MLAIIIPSNLVIKKKNKKSNTLFLVRRNFQVKFSSPCQKTVDSSVKAELEANVMVP